MATENWSLETFELNNKFQKILDKKNIMGKIDKNSINENIRSSIYFLKDEYVKFILENKADPRLNVEKLDKDFLEKNKIEIFVLPYLLGGGYTVISQNKKLIPYAISFYYHEIDGAICFDTNIFRIE